MIKRDITETTYEYDKEGKLIKKTVIETHEEEDNTITTTTSPWTYLNGIYADTVPTKAEVYANSVTACNCGNSCECHS